MKINKKEIYKIRRLFRYPKPNLPIPAVIVTCCLIDSLGSGKGSKKRFSYYIKHKMQETNSQLESNDKEKQSLINGLNCSFREHSKKKCKKSIDVLYSHIRCGFVHDYFNDLKGSKVINRPREKQLSIIVDQSKKHKEFALVINAAGFFEDFLKSLSDREG